MTQAQSLALIGFFIVGLTLVIFGTLQKNFAILVISGITWLAIYFTNLFGHTSANVYWAFNFVCLGLAIYSFTFIPIAAMLKSKSDEEELKKNKLSSDEELINEVNNIRQSINRLKGYSNTPSGKKIDVAKIIERAKRGR